jgi:hypothetical protein
MEGEGWRRELDWDKAGAKRQKADWGEAEAGRRRQPAEKLR